MLIISHLTIYLLSIAKFVKDNSYLFKFNHFGYIDNDLKTKIPLLIGNIHKQHIPLEVSSAFTNRVTIVAYRASLGIRH